MKMPLPLYEFKGSFREVGQQYGESCRDKIGACYDWWADMLKYYIPSTKTPDDYADDIMELEGYVRKYTPELYDEIIGIAEGSNRPLKDIMFLNGGLELVAANGGGIACSSYAAGDTATKDGKTYAGQNLDYFLDMDVPMIKQTFDNGLTVLAATIGYGCLPTCGINSNGLAHFFNVLATKDVKPGLPVLIYSASLLLKRDLRQVLMDSSVIPQTRAFNHMLAHADGSMVDLEVTPDHIGVVMPEKDMIAHANNFLTPWLQKEDISYGVCADTFFRTHRLRKLMDANYGKIDEEVLTTILGDKKPCGGYFSINCQPDPNIPRPEREESVMSFISVPAEGKLLLSTPSTYPEFYEYTL